MKILEEKDSIESYQTDASNTSGAVRAVALAESEQDIRDLMAECQRRAEHLSISGNGTGLVGGRVAQDGICLSLERMQNCTFDLTAMRATVQPGLSMHDFQALVSAEGKLYPPDPTEWSAALGGTLATNASGARTFRYGPTRRYVEALRVVLANSDVLALHRGQFKAKDYHLHMVSESGREYDVVLPKIHLPQTSKHAAGYYSAPDLDAVDLFVGSAGTLGVITEAQLRIVEAPERLLGVIMFCTSYDDVLSAVEELRPTATSNGPISPRLVEFFDEHALHFISSSYPSIPSDAKAALWMEQEYLAENEDQTFDRWMDFIQRYSKIADQCWIANDDRRHAEFRAFRHALPSAVYEKISSNRQSKVGTDIAVPQKHFREFFQFYQDIFAANNAEYVLFGHIGNCHLHANIFSSAQLSYEQSLEVYDACISKGLALEGTVSAEHGIGKLKRKYLRQMWGDQVIEEMKRVKTTLDPTMMLSPGNMFE